MPHHSFNHLAYHYTLAGAGNPILFLHGFTGCGDNWQLITDPLAAHFRPITIDLPGHGQTDSPADPARYQMEAIAADLHEFITRVIQAPVHLVGYSMGGRLALYLARHYPASIRHLLLESASPGLANPTERATRRTSDDQLAARILANGIPAFVEEWDNLPLFASQSPDIRQRLHTQRLQNNPLGLANSLRGMGTGVQPPVWDSLPNLKSPTLILNGARDTKFVSIGAHMAALIPNAHQRIFPDVGHAVHLEAPADYATALGDFLGQ